MLVLIYHAKNPRALRGFLKSSCPVYWQSAKTGWMSGPVYSLNGSVISCTVKTHTARLKYGLVDAPGHPPVIETYLKHIHIIFLLPSMIPLFQPMCIGVIATFKAYYL